jgi:hypothetical protein
MDTVVQQVPHCQDNLKVFFESATHSETEGWTNTGVSQGAEDDDWVRIPVIVIRVPEAGISVPAESDQGPSAATQAG